MSYLQIENVTKSYRGGVKALGGVSLEIQRGEAFSLLGVNGAGKSTLSSILCGLHAPTSGTVHWNGVSIYDDVVNYRRHLGYCPQIPNLDPEFTMRELLVFSGRCYGLSKIEAEERCEKLGAQFQLGSYFDSQASELSGGYRQRFLIARALIHSPELLILDEPTVGLDAHIRKEIIAIIGELKKEGITILLTTHYLDEAEALSDRVCLIHKGLIRKMATPKDLLDQYSALDLEDVFLQFVKESEE